jgi:hypothetical protein
MDKTLNGMQLAIGVLWETQHEKNLLHNDDTTESLQAELITMISCEFKLRKKLFGRVHFSLKGECG